VLQAWARVHAGHAPMETDTDDADTRRLLLSLVEQALALLWILCEHLDAAVEAVSADTAVLAAAAATLAAPPALVPTATRLVAGTGPPRPTAYPR
jgi:hypothetical protein